MATATCVEYDDSLPRSPMQTIRSRYRLIERLGAGGMAEVYRGTLEGEAGFSRTVAIKRVLPGLSADSSFAEMFTHEARIASLLSHPNIVSVLDFDRDESGQLFLVMELVEGRDLRRLASFGRLPVSVSAFVAGEVLRALAFAHNLEHRGGRLCVVHRDISPHNILISWDGAVKLGDFGIAKAGTNTSITSSGVVKGKMAYLSPEQAQCEELDGRSDLFAVGIMLHELLTGVRLFAAPGALDGVIVYRVLHMPIASPRDINPEVSPELANVCLTLLERDRARRFQTAQAALEALFACKEITVRGQMELAQLMHARFPSEAPSATWSVLKASTVTADTTSLPQPTIDQTLIVASEARSSRRSHLPIFAGGVALLAALVAAGALFAPQRPSPPIVVEQQPAVQVASAVQESAPIPAIAAVEIALQSEPSGAQVFIEEESSPRGSTPLTLSVPPESSLNIRLERIGYEPRRENIRAGEERVFSFKLVRKQPEKERRPRTTEEKQIETAEEPNGRVQDDWIDPGL